MNVGTTSRFANRVKVAGTEFRFQEMDGLEMRSAFPKPIGKARTCTRSRLNLDKGIQVGEPLLYRLKPEPLVVASEETAQIAARNGT